MLCSLNELLKFITTSGDHILLKAAPRPIIDIGPQ